MSITSQGWILVLLVSLFSVGSDVQFIEALCYNNNNSYYISVGWTQDTDHECWAVGFMLQSTIQGKR